MLGTIFLLNALAAVLVIASTLMKGMTKLRIIAILADAFEFAAAALSLSWLGILRYAITMPTNSVRLWEMLNLVKRTEMAAKGDLSMDWLKQYMQKTSVKAGETVFARGDLADRMYMVDSGQFQLIESGIQIGVGQLVGEIGLLTPGNVRTQGLKCENAGTLLEISYEDVRELYYQNPRFGFYFLTLSSRRLLENVARLEAELARRPEAPAPQSA